jgi:type IV pilus biogenesis protein CpaD/CtpE
MTPQVTRRVVLGAATTAALAGCARKRPQEPSPRPDLAVLVGAIAGEEQLIALYESTRTRHPELAQGLDPLLAHHRAHLTVLRRHYVPGTDGRPAPQGTPGVAATSRVRRQAVTALRTAENRAAAARMADVTRVSAGMAQLFASIGACEAGHAAWLKRLA